MNFRQNLFVLAAVVFLCGTAFTFSSPGSPFATGEALTPTNMNEIDTALDNLEAGTSIAASLTRDTEWDTLAELESVTGANIIIPTEIDTLTELNALTTDNDIQPLDSDLTAIAALTTTATGLSILDDASTSAMRTTLGVAIGSNVQAYDTDLDDLADGTLTGSKVGTGVPDASVASTLTRDTEWDTIGEIETATSVNVIVSTEIPTFTTSSSAASGNCTVGDLWLKTSATATLYGCTATNTWTAL